jgi:hypothetical protein
MVDWSFFVFVALVTRPLSQPLLQNIVPSARKGLLLMTRGYLTPALRPLIRRPGLALARLVTVAIVVFAIAAVTAIASATLLRPLPFPDPDRLVSIYSLSNDTADVTQATPLFPV